MRLLLATIYKEYLQLVRNRTLLFLVLACPIVVLGIIPFAFDGGVRIRAGVCDTSSDDASVEIEKRLAKSPLFHKLIFYSDVHKAEADMDRGKLDMILIVSGSGANLVLDGTYPRRAANSLYAIASVGFERGTPQLAFQTMFNAGKAYKNFFLVSLIILIVTVLGSALITLNIVNERECGLEEQFRATAIKSEIYLIGKYIFFILLSLFEITICYIFCHIVYGLRIEGSLIDLFIVNLLFILPLIGIGALIASISQTQLRAVYILTIVLVLLSMLSTMFSHLSSMPEWAAMTRFVNPIYYGVETSRKVVLMGASLIDIWKVLVPMGISGIASVFASILIMRRSRG